MGQLILLPRAERSSRPMPNAECSAEILFFTGVRYYRMAEEPAPVAKVRRRRRSTNAKIAATRIDCHA